ncbi:hypothetical protein Tco_0693470 [Tanacetum coccineum]
MDLPRALVKIFTRLKMVSKKGKFRQAPYTPLPATTPITKKRQSKRCKMNSIPMASLDDDDCQIIPLKYWAEDTKPVPRTQKRYNTGIEGGYLTRQPGADWAIVGPYFCAFVMRVDVPFWPANGIKYPVP